MKLIFGILLCLIMAIGAFESSAEQDIQSQINQTKNKIKQKRNEEKSVLGKLLNTQKELDKISKNLNQINSQMGTTEERIKVIKSELQKAEEELRKVKNNVSEREKVLNQRIVAIYKYGYQSYLEILFQAKNFGDFVTRFELVGHFVHKDLYMLKELQQRIKQINQKKAVIADKQSELEREKRIYSRLQEQTKIQHSRYLDRVQDHQEQLASIQKDRRKLEAMLDELERISKSMESQIREYQSRNQGVVGSGELIWPTTGRITSPFGYRVHPILKKRKYHSGIDIAAPRGTPIVAADSGVIIFSGNNGGYGKMISINHGNGISTVYAHCDVLLVSAEQKVSKGQRIALVGSTGLSTGPHLHFEVRKNGVPTNPLSYL